MSLALSLAFGPQKRWVAGLVYTYHDLYNRIHAQFLAGLSLHLHGGFEMGRLTTHGVGSFAHVILPSITLALGFIPYYIRLIRSSMREEMKKPHVLFARARGVKETVILRKHIFKGILPQLITSLAMTCGGLLGGAAIIENVFAISGVGHFIVEAMLARDYAVLQAFIVIIGDCISPSIL